MTPAVKNSHNQDREANDARLDYVRRRLGELADYVSKHQITGNFQIYVPVLSGRIGRVRVIREEHQHE